MARIDATVTATDIGGKFKLRIDKPKIDVPPGKHQILFKLDDKTTSGSTKFDKADPIFHTKGSSCPKSGHGCVELSVEDCTDDLLTLGDDNGSGCGPVTMRYQLNFKHGNRKKHLDPIIINH